METAPLRKVADNERCVRGTLDQTVAVSETAVDARHKWWRCRLAVPSSRSSSVALDPRAPSANRRDRHSIAAADRRALFVSACLPVCASLCLSVSRRGRPVSLLQRPGKNARRSIDDGRKWPHQSAASSNCYDIDWAPGFFFANRIIVIREQRRSFIPQAHVAVDIKLSATAWRCCSRRPLRCIGLNPFIFFPPGTSAWSQRGMRVLTFLVVLELLPRLAGKIILSELIYELEGKYSLESTDPRESEIRAPPRPLPYLMPISPNTLFYNKKFITAFLSLGLGNTP